MAAKKTAAKKTVAKKATAKKATAKKSAVSAVETPEATQVPDGASEDAVAPVARQDQGVLGEWPLDEGAFYPRTTSRFYRWGATAEEQEAIRKIQERLGTEVTGEMSPKDVEAVQRAQRDAGMVPSGIVDRATWETLSRQA